MGKIEMPLSKNLVTTLIKKGTEMTESISEVVKTEDLTIQQFNVLHILRGRRGESACLHDVSDKMIHSNSNTTRVIDKLVIKGYVERIQCPTDRRKIQLTITKLGLKVLERLDHLVDIREETLIKNIDPKQVELILDVLSKI